MNNIPEPEAGIFWQSAKRPHGVNHQIIRCKRLEYNFVSQYLDDYAVANRDDIAAWKKSQNFIYCRVFKDGVLFFNLNSDDKYLLLSPDDVRIKWLLDNVNIVGFNLSADLKAINIQFRKYIDIASITRKSFLTLCRDSGVMPYVHHPSAKLSNVIDRYIRTDACAMRYAITKWNDEISRRDAINNCGEDRLSVSFATVAERVFLARYQEVTGHTPPKNLQEMTYRFQPPLWLDFKSPQLGDLVNRLMDIEFDVTKDGLSHIHPIFDDDIMIAGKGYSWGRGGLHSTQKRQSYYSDDAGDVYQIDVFSNYPSVILDLGVHPAGDNDFLRVYEEFYNARKSAKGFDKQTYKDILNVLYGKFNSPSSVFYSPANMLRVTLTTQLYILCLIDRLEYQGISVVAANTDGLTIKIPNNKLDVAKHELEIWEAGTSLRMEWKKLQSAHYKDIVNYITVSDGEMTVKGNLFTKEPHVSYVAVENWLLHQKPIEETVNESSNSDFGIPSYHSRSIVFQSDETSILLPSNLYLIDGVSDGVLYDCDTLEALDKFKGLCPDFIESNVRKASYIDRCKDIFKKIGISY